MELTREQRRGLAAEALARQLLSQADDALPPSQARLERARSLLVALAIACPVCLAPAGEWCTALTPPPYLIDLHPARREWGELMTGE